jgi:hypothetical protein
MRILITDCGPPGGLLALRLTGAGHEVSLEFSDASKPPDVAIVAVSRSGDLDRVRELRGTLPGVQLLALTRIALPEIADVEDLGITLMFPGFSKGLPGYGPQQRSTPLGLPGTVAGPLVGRPRAIDRWFVGLLRSAGIRASSRADMQAWLTVTSTWLSSLRGAILAAARQGLTLDTTPDLITVAARAVRERLRLLRAAHFPLDAGCFCLLSLPESWAIATVREIAENVRDVGNLPCVPSPEEAVGVSEQLKVLTREQGVKMPAADFLDGFIRGETEISCVVSCGSRRSWP